MTVKEMVQALYDKEIGGVVTSDDPLEGLIFRTTFTSSGSYGTGNGSGAITFPIAMDGYYAIPTEVDVLSGSGRTMTYTLSGGDGGSGTLGLNSSINLGNNTKISFSVRAGGSSTSGTTGYGNITLKITKNP